MLSEHTLFFQPGLVVYEEFKDYTQMQKGAKNWLFHTKYRFSSGDFYGYHDGVQLENLQFGHGHQFEGILFQGYSPKDCLSIVVVQKLNGQLCINDIKMNLFEIIVLDDTQAYDFTSSDQVKIGVLSVEKCLLEKLIPDISSMRNKKYIDIDNILSDTIENEWKYVLNNKNISHDSEKLHEMQESMVNAIVKVLDGQTALVNRLTDGEKTAIKIKSFLLNSLEENISISKLSRRYKISERTFQNSFKSLYGMTPKYFIQMIKINKVHEDLQSYSCQYLNISEIAMKWGFTHLGRFSKSYENVFGELPSVTFKKEKIERRKR